MTSTWQAIEGAGDCELTALLNKPSITNSNAYLIRTPGKLVIIDPGNDAGQIERINELIAESQAQHPRRLVILLTHSHLDHYGGVEGLRTGGQRPLTLAHHYAAAAIREKSRERTLALLYRDAHIPDLPVDIELFTDRAPESAELRLTRRTAAGPEGVPIIVEELELEPGLPLQAYTTPGHSPCSCTFRVGPHLFIGDIPFASSPGLAGLLGWNGQDLIASTQLLRQLIAEHGTESCWAGHGAGLAAADAVKLLGRVDVQVHELGAIAPIDEDRIVYLRHLASEMLRELQRLFATLAARLLYVSHRLEQLEENDEAARVAQVLDIDSIEALLEDFEAFCNAFEAGMQPELSVSMKAAASLAKLRKVLATHHLAARYHVSLLQRAEYLIGLFMQCVQGLAFESSLDVAHLPSLIETLLREERLASSSDEDMLLAASDSEEGFRRMLVDQLTSSTILSGLPIELRVAPGIGAHVRFDPACFESIFLSTLEMIAANHAPRRITISVTQDDNVQVRISADAQTPLAMAPVRAALYHRVMQEINGDFEAANGEFRLSLQAALPAAA